MKSRERGVRDKPMADRTMAFRDIWSRQVDMIYQLLDISLLSASY